MKRPRKQAEWKKVMRTEAFSVYQNRSQGRRFRINWNDHAGLRRRYRLWANSVEDAAEKARDLIAGHDPEEMVVEATAERDGLLVVEAFEKALAAARRNERSRRDWQRDQNRFIKWLADYYPLATHWRLFLLFYDIIGLLRADQGLVSKGRFLLQN